MPGQIHRFQELSVVRADAGEEEGWIIGGGRYEGLFGPAKSRLWQVMADGTVRFADLAARTFYAQLKIGINNPAEVSAYPGDNRLWIVPHDEAQGDAVAIDLEKAEITARVSGVRARKFGLGRVTQNGSLILQTIARIDDGVYDQFHHVDADTLEVSESRVACPKASDSTASIHFICASPRGTFWLRPDHTHFPVVEHSEFPGAPPRKYYGYTVQLWSAFPLKFERRIVVAWLKAEDLPDETHILRADALIEFNKRMSAQNAGPAQPAAQPRRGLFGRRATSPQSGDPDRQYREVLAASAPERDRIYSAMSAALHRPEADPQADYPTREAFGEAGRDDALWAAIGRNSGPLYRDTLHKVVGWEGEDAVWFDRLGHLICVGMDGAVSPQIWFERAGMQRMMRAFPNLPGRLEVLDGRRLHAVKRPSNPNLPSWSKMERIEGGSLIVDGSPAEPRYEPVRISKYVDGWQGPESIPASHFNEEKDRAAADEFRKNRSTVTIPLKGSDPAAKIEAICAYRDLLDPSFFDRANGSAINVRFKLGGKHIPEAKFFAEIGPQDRDWAAAPLRELVSRYAELRGHTVSTIYQNDGEDGSLLAQAAHRLGEMDEGSIPTLIAYGEGIDGGHEYYFAGDTVPAVVRAHGWTDDVTGFVAWALAFNYYNTYDAPSTIWRHLGLGEALARRPAKEAASFVHARLSPFVEAGRLDWNNFACLRQELGERISEWERDFFDELVTLTGEKAFELS